MAPGPAEGLETRCGIADAASNSSAVATRCVADGVVTTLCAAGASAAAAAAGPGVPLPAAAAAAAVGQYE